MKQGRYVAVEEVHHIVPLSEGGTNDESNLMSLCRSMPREDPQGTRRPVGAVGISTRRPPGKRRGAFCAKKAKSNG
ncbi:MAG: HNH endonuclease signature motif containing protein [Catenisphaera adipataccumulans]|uniref:HNH endonuclease signature motif containing protein n=1 Tax=Catenisphaera adipataccumulans TaxID=700500 RepID=UPI003D908F67